MYQYYLFNIDNEVIDFFKHNNSYLFSTLNTIYKSDFKNINNNYLVLNDLVNEIPKVNLNLLLFNSFKNDDYYIKFKNKHIINDYFSKEHSELFLNNLYIKVSSSYEYPTFFKELKNTGNWFICDFKNINYFWL